jgi:hypothetical protein
MSTPTIPAGNLFMNATLYTGNSSTQTITNGVAGQSFQPDMVWTKARANAYSPNLYDSVRGVNQNLQPNSTGADFFNAGSLTAFNTNGFTLGANDNGNASSSSVAWQWKAGGTAVSNTSGSITSQVSANTTSGFSVVTYTGTTTAGQTVGHGLGVAPSFIIAKSRTGGTLNWVVYSSVLGKDQLLQLNNTASVATVTSYWGTSTPNSTVFGVGQGTYDNNNGNMVAYCWAPIAGYSQFGSYTGNNSTDGPFVYTGFRPRFVMTKCSSATTDWTIHDTSRNTYNVADASLYSNTSGAEATLEPIDILSNGFKIRSTAGNVNASGQTYIYAAFAEVPFKFANGR